MTRKKPELLTANMSALVREETLEGRQYLVAPVVLIVEGVVNGLLYMREELEKFPAAWNGRPVPVYHPQGDDGKYITANSPKEREARRAGELYNVYYANGKLKGEAWLDRDKLLNISPESYDLLANDQRVEVSTGLFFELEKKEGEYRGKKYRGIVHNIRPDHLAILPGQTGACSWDDGAGMPRVNHKMENENDGVKEKKMSKVTAALKALRECVGTFMANAMSNREVEDSLRNIIRQREAVAENVFIVDVFPHEVVYEVWNGEGANPRLFKVKYNKGGKGGAPELDGPSEEVVVETSYKPASPAVNEPQRTPEPESTQSLKEGVTMEREKRIDALIAEGRMEAGEKQHLMALNDATFEKLFAEPVVVGEGIAGETGPVGNPGPVAPEEAAPKTVSDFIGNAPDGIKQELEALVQSEKDRRVSLVGGLVANKKNPFKQEELEGMSSSALEKLTQALTEKPAGNFAGNRGTGEPAPAIKAPVKVAPMGMPVVAVEEKK